MRAGLARELLIPLVTRVRSSRIQRGMGRDSKIVIGPWHSEIGFELLYWIPMARWVMESLGLPPERAIAVSRGGVSSWYQGIATEYVELLHHWTPAEIRDQQRQRMESFGVQKQVGMLDAERELLSRVAPEDATILHPQDMYKLFRFVWSDEQPTSVVAKHTSNRTFSPLSDEDVDLPALPERYVAIKAYFSDCFPDTPDNREFVATLIDGVSESHDVVLLDVDVGLDEHVDFHADQANVTSIRGELAVDQNLAVQTRVIAGADALLSTYGGFSYLGPYLGVPSLCFFSNEDFNHTHLDVMNRATRELARRGGGAPFIAVSTADAPAVSRLVDALRGLAVR